MKAVTSPWFWLALLGLVIAAFMLWRRSASAATGTKAVPKSVAPKGGGGTDESDIAIAAIKAATSIFDTVYTSSDDNDDED